MAYGVGSDYARGERISPEESREGHWEYDYNSDLGRSERVWVSDENGNIPDEQ